MSQIYGPEQPLDSVGTTVSATVVTTTVMAMSTDMGLDRPMAMRSAMRSDLRSDWLGAMPQDMPQVMPQVGQTISQAIGQAIGQKYLPLTRQGWQWTQQAWQSFEDRPLRHWLQLHAMLLCLPLGVSGLAYQVLGQAPQTPLCPLPGLSEAEQLHCLQQQMRQGKPEVVLAGIQRLQAWPEQSPLQAQARVLLVDWTQVLWTQAQLSFEAGRWEVASRLLQGIPADSALADRAQAQLAKWQEIRETGEALQRRVKAAIAAQDWQLAQSLAQELTLIENDYWRQQGLSEMPRQIASQQGRLMGGKQMVRSGAIALERGSGRGAIALERGSGRSALDNGAQHSGAQKSGAQKSGAQDSRAQNSGAQGPREQEQGAIATRPLWIAVPRGARPEFSA